MGGVALTAAGSSGITTRAAVPLLETGTMDWLSPVSGFVGTVVGAGVSYFATRQAQANTVADARQARLQAKQDQAVTALAAAFGALHQHARHVPNDRERWTGNEEAAALRATCDTWNEQLQNHIAPARIAIGVIRDSHLRHRLDEAMKLLETWNSGLENAFHGRDRVWLLRGIIAHAVDCVGAWQREEPLPEPNHAFARARDSLATKEDEWEAEAEAREEERQRRAAAPGD
ncbi:hypothetical protein [Virgisporangium aurantiacum]|uniref:Uncharacterized protein n=1 Tax=Virgisporangium aurantiacum TaxID=175570 RepID=A0A8J3Z8H8_9ACTN|nr:hypothetical protein [Virgisporangium aurantiacum]GIJ57156.1 hypothetical protein Vau01_046720 [Virgisporangium aurantiacum]